MNEIKRTIKPDLTIRHAQRYQPWTLPYAQGVMDARGAVPHILATHCALHAAKSIGKLCAVFEELDHPANASTAHGDAYPHEVQLKVIRNMAADLVVAALRFANLYNFDLQTVLVERVTEKNGHGFEPIDKE